MNKEKLTHYKIQDFDEDIKQLKTQVANEMMRSGKYYKGIYGIPRGGLAPAMALSNELGIPLVSGVSPESLEKILVVDDVVDSGATIKKYNDWGFHTAALHIKTSLTKDLYPTYFSRRMTGWIHYWWESNGNGQTETIEDNVRRMIQYIGDDPARPGLIDTPKRVAKMYRELFRGYDPEAKPKLTVFDNGEDGVTYDEMIRDDGYFFSLCEHHIIPFFGKYYFGYIPDKLILGASKIGKLVDYYAGRLQIAERLVNQVVAEIETVVKPHGSIMVMNARHLCKEMRGLKKWNSPYETIAVRGWFKDNKAGCKDEFLARIGR